MLSDLETSRLIKLLGMLGSSFAGERAVAGEKANELLRSKGLTWESYLLGGRSLKAEAPQATGRANSRARYDADRNEPVAFVATLVAETLKAVLVDAGLETGPVWIPKSQIIDQQPHGKAHLFGIPKWLADAKGVTPWSDV